ncbi:RlpA-like double-psi beta-barrel domain-containing protein [Fodinicola feengrottensis]|uniref:hypothetical protein n=1 Tax=Fodinicola feengrottensis TaxID=435914 RepID=UPI002440F52F|nr:hypothetical protein [Fodinicola feengrottensis]
MRAGESGGLRAAYEEFLCGGQTCCEGQCRSNRVVDLTAAAFSRIANLNSGLVPVEIRA